LLIGLLLTLSPWLWRNWQLTGENLIADSQPTGAVFRFSSFGLEDSARLPGETDEEFLSRMRANAFSEILNQPMATIGIIASHFWHNQISTLLVMPASFLVQPANELSAANLSRMKSLWNNLWQQCCSIQTYVHDLPYWRAWDGHLVQTSWLPLLTSLLLISIGIGISWNRWQFTGLFPLFVTVSYSLSNTLGRISGWRYNLPVDWVGMLYFAVGLTQVCYWIATFFSNRFIPQSWKMGVDATQNVDQLEKPFPWKRGTGIAAAMIMLVAFIPLAEQLIPARYVPGTLQTNLNALSSTLDQSTLQRFLSDGDAIALEGRTMYPRFYQAGDGIPKRNWPSFLTRDYPRLGFLLVGDETYPVVLPLEESPEHFPNAADVLVLGCKREDHIEARLVAFLDDLKTTITTSPPKSWSCASP
jgi:hypothetical protein